MIPTIQDTELLNEFTEVHAKVDSEQRLIEIRNQLIDYYNVDKVKTLQIDCKSRKREIVTVRYIFCWLTLNKIVYNDKALGAVGRMIGRLDHSTVLHGRREVDKQLSIYKGFRTDLQGFLRFIGHDSEWNNETKKLTIL